MTADAVANTLADPTVTVLGPDPSHRSCVLNGNAFQQDALASLNGWQYAVFYSSLAGANPEPVYVHVARRQLPEGPWDVLSLTDYAQTIDDGHNTVQLGVCAGDGTIHLSFDHHCDVLRYRRSVPGLALDPGKFPWAAALFAPTQGHLPGIDSAHTPFRDVTYPRFIPAKSDLLFSFRAGKAGLGDDHLYVYRSATGQFECMGRHLIGVENNPYVHGMDVDPRTGRLHVSWVYRGLVEYDGWDDPLDTKHKQQAGPNGAENNHDVCYAYSDDCGVRWFNTDGAVVADLKTGDGVRPDAPGVVVFEIPKGSGLTNQESQAVGQDGGVHVLNRTFESDGRAMWRHFYREPETGTWKRHTVGPVTGGKRGRLAVGQTGNLFAILPDSVASTMAIWKAAKDQGYARFEQMWQGGGLSGEPLVDVQRLAHGGDGILSVFARSDRDCENGEKDVVVLDFNLHTSKSL